MSRTLRIDALWMAALVGLLMLSGGLCAVFSSPVTLEQGDDNGNQLKRANWQSLHNSWGKRGDEKGAATDCSTWLRTSMPNNEKSRYEAELDELQPFGMSMPGDGYEPQPNEALMTTVEHDDPLGHVVSKRQEVSPLNGVASNTPFEVERYIKERRELALQEAAAALDEQLLAHGPVPENHVRFGYAAGKQPVSFLIKTILFGEPQALDETNEEIVGEKRSWKSMNTAWGKRRNAPDWNKFRGAWGKREGWNNLKGMWGKRAPVPANNWSKFNIGWGKRDLKEV